LNIPCISEIIKHQGLQEKLCTFKLKQRTSTPSAATELLGTTLLWQQHSYFQRCLQVLWAFAIDKKIQRKRY